MEPRNVDEAVHLRFRESPDTRRIPPWSPDGSSLVHQMHDEMKRAKDEANQ